MILLTALDDLYPNGDLSSHFDKTTHMCTHTHLWLVVHVMTEFSSTGLSNPAM